MRQISGFTKQMVMFTVTILLAAWLSTVHAEGIGDNAMPLHLANQHYVAGIRHFKEQKLREAIEEWDQALALNPKLESAKRSQERARKLLKHLEEIK